MDVLEDQDRDVEEQSERCAPDGHTPHPYLRSIVRLLEQVEARNLNGLDEAATAMWRAIAADRLIHVIGSGHSTLFALEAFYRAGGLAAINPIWHPALLPLMGGRMSTFAERLDGVGTELVRSARLSCGDVAVIFSNSGVNPVSVEAAEAAKAGGGVVIAVVSLTHSSAVPSRHPRGLRLGDVADIVLDTGAPVGDASYVAAPGLPAVAAVSTILGAYVWNALVVRVADKAVAAGCELDVWASSNVPGGDARADRLLARYSDRVRALG